MSADPPATPPEPSDPGLAWPDHDTGPTPPPGYRSRERDEDRLTRKPLAWWDRIKFLLLLGTAFAVFTWSSITTNPPLENAVAVDPVRGISDALTITWRSFGWLLVLAALELVRQLHYLISERSARYHRFFNHRVFGGFNRRAARMNDWNRFRLARAAKWAFMLALLSLLLGKLLDTSPPAALIELPVVIFRALPFVLRAVLILFVAVGQFVAIFWFLSRGGTEVYFPDDIKTRFTDVWGQDSVLEKIKENMVFLEDPESIERRGGYVPGGILLWGPPGTGKTLMAEAVAGETGKPFVFVDPGAFIQMFFGVGILKVKALFRKLRKLALRYGGVIVFFDEADSLGNRGSLASGGWGGAGPQRSGTGTAAGTGSGLACNGLSYLQPRTTSLLLRPDASRGPEPPRRLRDRIIMGGMGGGGGMGTLQALLTELSGLKKPRGFFNRTVRKALGMRPKPPPKYRILVMMATNMPQALDEALLRPGRIDRIYKVSYPSKAGRIRTYQGYLNKVSHELTPAQIDKLATITPYATGASIKDLVNEALVNAIRDDRETITWQDVLRAKLFKSLGPGEDVEYIERERHAVAVHEACHAVAAYRVRRHLAIDIATIEKGQTYLGMVASVPLEEQFTQWRSQYEADIMVALASLAGERMFFDGDNSSGVSGDLQSATTVAMLMEGYWGMGGGLGSHAVTKAGYGSPVSASAEDGTDRRMLETALGGRVERSLKLLYDRVEALLMENRRAVLAVAHALESDKTLTGEDVEAIIEGREGPLVDGRWYATAEFLAAAEEYHASAVVAHQGHRADVGLALPRRNGALVAAAAGRGEAATEPRASRGPRPGAD